MFSQLVIETYSRRDAAELLYTFVEEMVAQADILQSAVEEPVAQIDDARTAGYRDSSPTSTTARCAVSTAPAVTEH